MASIPLSSLPYLLHQLGPWLAASALAAAAFWLAATLRIETGVAKSLQNFQSGPQDPSSGELLGERLGGKLPIARPTWEDHLRWAQRGAAYPGWSFGKLIFISLLYGLCGVGVLLFNPAPVSLAAPLLAAVFPFLSLRSKANRVRKEAARSLPELAALVAAEMAAGVPAEQALQRATRLPGPLAELLREAQKQCQQTGRPLFSRKSAGQAIPGVLLEVFSATRLTSIRAFASQLDRVSQKGVAGAEQMSDIACSMANEYRAGLLSATKKLDSQLVLATAMFFFIPFVIVILGSFMLPILSLF
jgi:Flp pilus assembly protein TadB